jgi:hypothetical protein
MIRILNQLLPFSIISFDFLAKFHLRIIILTTKLPCMKFFFCALGCLLLFGSCKKDKKQEPTKTDLITSSSWKYESGGIDQDRNGTVDFTFESTGLLQPCILDNTGTFHADGTGVADEGATKCNASAPQTTPFTWSFASNETLINVNGQALFGLGGQFKVVELTSTRLELSKDTLVNFGGVPLTVSLIANLKH